MTTRICDKCNRNVNNLTELLDQYGANEVCDDCLKEADAIVKRVVDDTLASLGPLKRKAIADWFDKKPPHKKTLKEEIMDLVNTFNVPKSIGNK